MVGPSITDEERRRFLVRLRVGFSLFVGGSMALVGLYGDAGLEVTAMALVGGTAVGAVLAWFVLPDSIAVTRPER